MTQEEKNLLLQDLCTRLPYGVRCSYPYGVSTLQSIDLEDMSLTFNSIDDNYYELDRNIKPYLRSMSSMTEEEKDDLLRFFSFPLGAMYFNSSWGYVEVFKCIDEIKIYINDIVGLIDWLNKNMFDYRDLIQMGLALEAPKGVYNN